MFTLLQTSLPPPYSTQDVKLVVELKQEEETKDSDGEEKKDEEVLDTLPLFCTFIKNQ